MKLVFTLVLFLLFSCSGEVVKRSPSGVPEGTGTKRSSYKGIKKKILILNIANESPYEKENLGEAASSKLTYELDQSNRFILSPKNESKFGTSKEIYTTGGTKLSQIALMAKNEGIYLVVYGRILDTKINERANEIGILSYTNMQSKAALEVRVFDVFSNREILNEQFKGNTGSATFQKFNNEDEAYLYFRNRNLNETINAAVLEAVPKIVALADRLNWQGKIAKVDGQNIYLNSGRESGLQVGDILSVVTSGNEIFDPQTGVLLGVSRGIVKATIEVMEYFGDDGAIANLVSGGTISEGDLIEIY